MRALTVLAAVAALAAAAAPSGRTAVAGLPASWTPADTGPDGGVVYQGRIPNRFVPSDHRLSAVYLPPGYSAAKRYPVVYLLHGMAGSPSSIWNGLHLAEVADGLIASHETEPFIAVLPVAGPTVDPEAGEWAGVWESYLVQNVVLWVDAHLPTVRGPQGRALEGLCAGGFGAVDIGLRHPGVFGTLGSWEGYFAPVFDDGPFVDASAAVLRAHDPALLVRRDAASLRRRRSTSTSRPAAITGTSCARGPLHSPTSCSGSAWRTSFGSSRRSTGVTSGARRSPPPCSTPTGFLRRS